MEEKGSAGSMGRSARSLQRAQDRAVFTSSEALGITQSGVFPEFSLQPPYQEVCAWG